MFRRTTRSLLCVCAGLAVLASMGGCATNAHGPAYSQSIPASPPPGFALVYVFRRYAEPTAWGATVQASGQKVATLNQGGFTWMYLKAVPQQIRAAWPILSGQQDSFVDLDLADGSTHYIELVGVSKMAGVSAGLMWIRIGSGLNELKPENARAVLHDCCVLQPGVKTTY